MAPSYWPLSRKIGTMEANVSLVDLMELIQRDIEEKIEINRKLDIIMATQADNQAKIDALADTAEKIKAEVLDLKARYDAGQDLDFSRVQGLLSDVDAVNEDAVVPPVEPTPENPEA